MLQISKTLLSEREARLVMLGFHLAKAGDETDVRIDPEEPITVLIDFDDREQDYAALLEELNLREDGEPDTHALQILEEFVRDVEAVGERKAKATWPDIYVTYQKARPLVRGDEEEDA